MDVRSFETQINHLQANELNVKKYNQHSITGSVNVKKTHQAIFTTIPYSKGWHVKIDGKSVSTTKSMDTFLAFSVAPGKHTVKLVYWPPYMGIGLLISILAVLIVLIGPIINTIKRLIK